MERKAYERRPSKLVLFLAGTCTLLVMISVVGSIVFYAEARELREFVAANAVGISPSAVRRTFEIAWSPVLMFVPFFLWLLASHYYTRCEVGEGTLRVRAVVPPKALQTTFVMDLSKVARFRVTPFGVFVRFKRARRSLRFCWIPTSSEREEGEVAALLESAERLPPGPGDPE